MKGGDARLVGIASAVSTAMEHARVARDVLIVVNDALRAEGSRLAPALFEAIQTVAVIGEEKAEEARATAAIALEALTLV